MNEKDRNGSWKKSFPSFLKELKERNPFLKTENEAVRKNIERKHKLDVYQAISQGKPLPLEVYDSLTPEEKKILFFESWKEVSKSG